VPKPYPSEFRDDVVRVARGREPGVTIEQIARDFGVHPMTLQKWLRRADVDEGAKPGQTRTEAAETRELRKRNRLLEQENEVLRRAAAYLSQANLPENDVPARNGARRCRDPCDGDVSGAQALPPALLPVAGDPHHAGRGGGGVSCERAVRRPPGRPEFGHRLLADEARDAGEAMSDRTAWRIASSNGWVSAFGKPKRGKHRKPGPPVHDDLCAVVDEHGRTRHVFAAETANKLWLTDITEHQTAGGKLYLCAIKDAFSGRIVGYSIDSRMKSRLAVQALENAVAMRGDVAGCIVHSDRGSQFRSRKFRRALTRHHMVGSMGRVGSSGDNAAMESFFALMQKNVLDRRSWTTREQLRIAIVTWIERTYHRRRRQARLGRLTPIEFETIMNTTVALAA